MAAVGIDLVSLESEHHMTIDELIQREMEPQSFDWWGSHYENIVPALAEKMLGDGKALLSFTSMDTRPNRHLIRVDSSVSTKTDEELNEYVDESVIDAIADSFGECDEDCGEDCGCHFPTLILHTGYSYHICTEDE